MTDKSNSFGDDLRILKQFQDVLVLQHEESLLAICAAYQGRIMTSSSKGTNGQSYGWINYKEVAQQKSQAPIHAYGGEDRFWLGPEGGQYALYFDPGTSFDFSNWRVPACIDTEPMILVEKSPLSAHFIGHMELNNYAGFHFEIQVDRIVQLFKKAEIEFLLQVQLNDLHYVGFETRNIMTNIGLANWKKESGLLSIWILGMLKPGKETVIVIPVNSENTRHPAIKDDYFGSIPNTRLTKKEKAIFLKADGQHRGKIGLPYQTVNGYAGSYDAKKKLLTIVQYDLPEKERMYVNAAWEMQENPYSGDVVNAYNDGPVDDAGTQLGPFYELESSSPAHELQRGEAIQHCHRTFHFEGKESKLDLLTRSLLGVSLEEIKQAL